MASNEGDVTEEAEAAITEEEYAGIVDVMNEVIDKVDEIIERIDKNDFEVIATYDNMRNMDLDTIDEKTDVTVLDIGEEEIQVIDGVGVDNDSDVTVTDGNIDSANVTSSNIENSSKHYLRDRCEDQDMECVKVLSSDMKNISQHYYDISADQVDSEVINANLKHDLDNSFEEQDYDVVRTPSNNILKGCDIFAEEDESNTLSIKCKMSKSSLGDGSVSDSNSTLKSVLKMPSNEDISIESLLKYLRKQRASHNKYYPEIVDVD